MNNFESKQFKNIFQFSILLRLSSKLLLRPLELRKYPFAEVLSSRVPCMKRLSVFPFACQHDRKHISSHDFCATIKIIFRTLFVLLFNFLIFFLRCRRIAIITTVSVCTGIARRRQFYLMRVLCVWYHRDKITRIFCLLIIPLYFLM